MKFEFKITVAYIIAYGQNVPRCDPIMKFNVTGKKVWRGYISTVPIRHFGGGGLFGLFFVCFVFSVK